MRRAMDTRESVTERRVSVIGWWCWFSDLEEGLRGSRCCSSPLDEAIPRDSVVISAALDDTVDPSCIPDVDQGITREQDHTGGSAFGDRTDRRNTRDRSGIHRGGLQRLQR